ncbi:uncharacterized protein LOC111296623 isoform X1 [Durio zibethinus]|uniref:Uncharacterized protein LOC111296623 isoform X1 n=1 Tax=Durio zibethinus TaxID=66656 RepID=A0A6P5Z1X1_DURZI|nr:uncharacterized protein LOC111296623 isoform X1 [Durio zibethinus]
MAQGDSNFLHVATEMINEEEQRLKYLAFVQVTAVHVVLCLTNLFVYAKERSGLLKPGVEIVERIIKSLVRLVFDKYFNVPGELLKFVDRKVGESVTKIDRLVPPVIKQVSSEAISAAQKAAGVAGSVATEVQRAGFVSSASGFIKQVSSEAISAAQKAPGVGESVRMIDGLVPPFIKQVSSEAISATQNAAGVAGGVATAVQPAGVVSTASGFIKQVSSEAISAAQKAPGVGESVAKLDSFVPPIIRQVSSEAISAVEKAAGVVGAVATEVQHAGMIKNEEQKLKYLAFVQVAAVHAVLFFTNLYLYLKERSGPLKPGIEIVERMVKSVVRLFFGKYSDVPGELLKFVDGKVGEFVTKIDRLVPPVIKQVSSKAILVAQKAAGVAGVVATEHQHTGVVSTASGFIKQVSSEAISTAQKAPGVGESVTKIDRLVPPVIKQVSSESISAAQKAAEAAEGVATEVQNAGETLKYMACLQVAAVQVVLYLTKFFVYAKEWSGPLKPVVEIVEELVKSAVRLVFDKYFNNTPVELLKFVDSKVVESVKKIDRLVPPVIKQVSSEAISTAQKAAGVQLAGAVSTASGFIEKVGESVTKINHLVPPVIGQFSSGAILAAQKAAGVATEVQLAGAVSTASELIEQVGESVTKIDHLVPPVISQVSSKAISAAQKAAGLATEVQLAGAGAVSAASGFIEQVGESATKINRLVPPAISQVSSEAISAAQKAAGVAGGLASEFQSAGVVSTASGFIGQVSSEAISTAQKAPGVGESVTKLDSLVPSIIKQVSSDAISAVDKAAGVVGGVATEVHSAGVLSNASGFIQQVSSEAISAAQTDSGVGESLTKLDGLVPSIIKQVSSETISAADKAAGVATEVQHAGVVSTATGLIGQLSSEAISTAQKASGVNRFFRPFSSNI